MTLISTQNEDVVGVFRDDYSQMFPNARPLKATVRPESKLMEHPLESGAVVADHRVRMPTEIELSVIVAPEFYRDTYRLIQEAYDANASFLVQTRVSTYQNMVLQGIPHEESPDMAAVVIALKLKEVVIVTATFEPLPPRKVSNQDDSSTRNRGEQTGEPRSSTLNDVFGGYL